MNKDFKMTTNAIERQSPGGSLIPSAPDAAASIEPRDLSRLVGEGGLEAPVPVTEWTNIPLENGIWWKLRWAEHQANQKRKLPQVPGNFRNV
jgi:hypothetical protein